MLKKKKQVVPKTPTPKAEEENILTMEPNELVNII